MPKSVKINNKDLSRRENPWVDPLQRIENYQDFHQPLDYPERLQQASRCLNCGVPFCQSAMQAGRAVTGCPLHNLIPEWNAQIALKNDKLALERLLKTNPFPEFTSRVCPALCEKACIHALDEGATTIHDNEFFLIEKGFENDWIRPDPEITRSGKRVAVIGSGPSGLAAAHFLNQRGHLVDVIERDDRIGGLLMYGIPNMKLEKHVIDRRRELMEEDGIRFHTNCEAGVDLSEEELDTYDAVIFACGSRQPRHLPAASTDLDGVMYAVDFLSQSTENLLKGTPSRLAEGKKVVIVGGGDTGNDCLATALRQKAASVVQLELLKQKPEQRPETNPWPEWPETDKIDYGTQEAIALSGQDPRLFQKTIKHVEEEDGRLVRITVVDVDDSLQMVEGSEKVIECDLLLIAAGFTGIENALKESFSLPVTNRNTIETSGYRIGESSRFACGDCRRGQSLVVWALREGKECAAAVDEYLMGYTNLN